MYAESVLDRTVANGDAECPTGAAGVVIDRPVSYDIYRNVHKGIRLEMFAVTTELGSLDPDDVEACRRFAGRFRTLEMLLTKHAMHEDVHLEQAIAEALGDHAAELAAAHVVLESHVARIGAIIDVAVGATGVDRRAGLHMAYLELATFVAAYLQHQDDEERIVMRALDATFPTEVLAQLDAAIVSSIPPEILGQFLEIMLPGMNVLDRCELLAEIRDNAPVEAFAAIWALAGQVLATRDYITVAHRLDLAIDANLVK
jgi:hypothetical protein